MKSYSPTSRDRKGGGSKYAQERMSLTAGGGDCVDDCSCCHREKPHQRNRFLSGVFGAYMKPIPSYYLIPLLGFLLLLGYVTYEIQYIMPRVVSDNETTNFTAFSEERAWRYLRQVVGEGPRVAGSPYHRQQTRVLHAMLEHIAANATQTVLVDWQIVSGDYYLSHRLPYINAYRNVSNIMAKLSTDEPDAGNILLNCHYDSVPGAPGASDNAIFCAVLLETLLVMSSSKQPFKNNVIFLFNGAEESSLQGSHGFLRHPWAQNVTALINLDSTGMNGKSVLFQVTDPRVLRAYRDSVRMPSVQSFGEFLFTSGAVPSDTDFRIFRDFARIYGVDIAFSRYGHVYHTRYDSLELVAPGVLQHAGNMIHGLVTRMATVDDFRTSATEKTAAVYYDYLYLFMLCYSLAVADVVDSLVVVFACCSVLYYLYHVGLRWRYVKELLISVTSIISSFLCGCLAVLTLTVVMAYTSSQLRYYSNQWLVLPMYWAPFAIAAILCSHAFDKWRAEKSGLNRSLRSSQASAASRLVTAFFVLVLVFVPNAASLRYPLVVPLVLASAAAFVSLTVRRFWRLRAWQHLLLDVSLSLPTLLFILHVTLNLEALMIPVVGRSTTRRPDYTVAALNTAVAALFAMPLAGIELLFSRRRLWLPLSLVALPSLVLMLMPFTIHHAGTDPAPQRYNVFNVHRMSYAYNGSLVSESSGIWAGHTDALSPETFIQHALIGRQYRTDFAEDCERILYCDLPMTTPRTQDMVPFSVWTSFSPPTTFDPPTQVRLTDRNCTENYCTLNFTATITPYVSLIVWPKPGVTLHAWSFETPVINVTSKQDRPVYFVWHTHGTYQEILPELTFSLTVNVDLNVTDTSSELLDLAINAHKNHHQHEMTSEFRHLMTSLPEWFNAVPYMSERVNYVF